MAAKPTFRQRMQYFFDNYMSRGTIALIGGLAFLTLIVITIAATVVSLGRQVTAPEGSPPLSFLEAAWESLMRTFDAGTMGGDAGWGFRLVMLFVTIGGIFVVSTLNRSPDCRGGREDGGTSKGPLTGPREWPYAYPGLVAADLHHPLRTDDRQ